MRLVLLVVIIVFLPGPAAGQEKELPNIVIIMADDLGYGDLSAYGGWVQTPYIDRLAEKGLRFTDFHSSGTVCSPTRAGLMTGRYQQRASIPGVVFTGISLPCGRGRGS